ncbi:BTAD domain-containing putative transcriptional regulator [Streptomyces griseoluteus]|uniref:AfsR/SARP family transcriptional regulator n=1 Tax=Streptomyces griseoluteus TaxID=29306 RepID=UPI0034004919
MITVRNSSADASNTTPYTPQAAAEFAVLGPLSVVRDGVDNTPTAPKLRQVLGLLLLRRGQLVRTSDLIEELWGEAPSGSAVSTLQTYIHQIRKLLAEDPLADDRPVLHTTQSGYLLTLRPPQLDLGELKTLVPLGGMALSRGDLHEAERLLGRALALWRGRTLADVATGRLLTVHVEALEETRLRLLELVLETALRRGSYPQVISRLRALLPAHPLHEGFHAMLIRALHRYGQRGEALDVYEGLRNTLADRMGLDPSEKLRRLHEEVSRPPTAVRSAPPLEAAHPVPAELPPDLGDFEGREAVLDRIRQHVAAPSGQSAPRIAWVTGMPGVGKSAVAVRAAHRVKDHFPNGQLYADLAGTREPAEPARVLLSFLTALGLPRVQIPDDVEERGKLWRTASAGRRLLVMLDDAASAEQVEPLLPGSGSCAVLVTSRSHGLAGAALVSVEPMEPADGLGLLTNVLGTGTITRDRASAKRLVELCGGLPLALRAVAARASATGGRSLRSLADRLAAPETLLSTLRFGGLDVSRSYALERGRLADSEWSALRLLSQLPERTFTARQVAEAFGCNDSTAEQLLIRLAGNHLIRVEPRHDRCPHLRYSIHRITRAYVAQRVRQSAPQAA